MSPQIWTALGHARAQYCLLVAMDTLFVLSLVDKPEVIPALVSVLVSVGFGIRCTLV